jgi:sigma-B regulation protein RsbU (phosphoserine phosphatase)
MNESRQNDELFRLKNENQRLRRGLEELSILNEIATAISSTQALDRILDLIVQKCLKHLKVEQGAVMLLDEKKQDKPFETVVRRGDTARDRLPFRLDAQLTGWMLKYRIPLLINDFLTDKRFTSYPDEDFPIQSLLAVPLTAKGKMIGLIGVFNKRSTGGFEDDDQRLLSIIATQSAQVIENARLLEEEQALLRMQEELRLAYEIQTNLLPTETPQIAGYDITGRSVPAKEVGGDYFDFIPIDEHRLAFCLGDVSGKGMPAALLMSNLQATVRAQTTSGTTPGDCVTNSNSLLFRSTTPEKFATFFYAILDTEQEQLSFCNAGHNYPFLMSHDREQRQLTTTGIVLGALESFSFQEEVIPFKAGDLLVIYSDGITEAMDDKDEEFGEERLAELISSHSADSADSLTDAIFESVRGHAGDSLQTDDMTLLVIKRE